MSSRRAGKSSRRRGPRPVIGLEVHVQLRTASKMFCGCPNRFGAPPNTLVCPVCLGLPGALPVPNGRAVRLGLRAARILGCRVHPCSRFDRKHYFYPDLPKGYQITQHYAPLATEGRVVYRLDGEVRTVSIRRVHLEEDAGKSIHDRFPGRTAVDLNRAGVPLLEVVTEPEIPSPAEARAVLLRLKQLLQSYASVSDCNMEEGSLRVDANLSVASGEQPGPAARTEVKNLNSFAHVEKALAYETERRMRLAEAVASPISETRLFDPQSGVTRPLRSKEEVFDYRYAPDPDLAPLHVSEEEIEEAATGLPEPPHRVEERLMSEYGLPESAAVYIAALPERAAFFDAVARGQDADVTRHAANLLRRELAEKAREADVEDWKLVPADRLRRVAELRRQGVLSAASARRVVELLANGENREVDRLIAEQELARIDDEQLLARWVSETVRRHPTEAERYRAGEEKLLGWFMGQVMRAAGGRADPVRLRALLQEVLGARRPENRESDP